MTCLGHQSLVTRQGIDLLQFDIFFVDEPDSSGLSENGIEEQDDSQPLKVHWAKLLILGWYKMTIGVKSALGHWK